MATGNKIKIKVKNKNLEDSIIRKNAVFTKEEEIFIIEQFAILKSPTAVKRAFIRKYKDSKKYHWLMNLKPTQFQRVNARFIKNEISKSFRSISISEFTKNNPEKMANLGCK